MTDHRPLTAVTHSGAFHADDVVAWVVIRAALGEVRLFRTRDPEAIARADIVFDVGAIFDPKTRRFDHHQRGAPQREDGEPYSSAGLVWRAFGRKALEAWYPEAPQAAIEEAWVEIDRRFILLLDRIDNGAVEPDALSLSAIVGTLCPAWDEAPDYDGAFERAAEIAEAALRGFARHDLARIAARQVVLEAHEAAADKRVIELPRSMPWHEAAHEAGLPALYAVYPDSSGSGYLVNAMPTAPGRFNQKLPLPSAWAGLRDEALARVSGIPDAVFCHNGRFICGARTRAGALAMAAAALAAGASEGEST